MEEAAVAQVMVIKAVNRADHRQEEELGQEEEQDQEEQDHPYQEVDMEEAAQHKAAPRRSRQEELAIQEALHQPLQAYHNLNVIQIHGIHSIAQGALFQS